MRKLNLKKALSLLAHAFALWGFCAAVMGIGMAVMPLNTVLIVHAIAAPIIAAAVTSFYYWKFNHTTPLQTALCFVLFIILMDVIVVAMIINQSFEMFESFVGTWLVFMLIFAVTYLTGILWRKAKVTNDR